MRVAIVSPGGFATGNKTSADRISSIVSESATEVIRYTVDPGSSQESWRSFVRDNQVDAAIGIHGFHSGRILIDSPIPYALVFCNTDINRDLDLPERRELIVRAGQGAAVLGSYQEEMHRRVLDLFPEKEESSICIGKSVVVEPEKFSFCSQTGIPASADVFVVASGIREFKEPLYVAEEFQRLAEGEKDLHLVIIGAIRDEEFAGSFFEQIQGFSRIHYHEPVEREKFLGGLKGCAGAICSSAYEGVPNFVLEAMALRVPVLVRGVPGVQELIRHEESGLIFNSPQEFRNCVQRLLREEALRERLCAGATRRLQRCFSRTAEVNKVREVLTKLSEV